ncbi:MAG: thioredoxin [Oscillospiraceae bacterium]|nr:thioredoxin [Oscillospiraceae bacterium]
MTVHFTKEGFEKALASGQLMMVDFWADWCGPCKMLAPVIEGLGDDYEGKAIVGKINVDEEQELAIRYGVMSIPTVIFFKDGEEVERKVGVLPGTAFTQVLDSYL